MKHVELSARFILSIALLRVNNKQVSIHVHDFISDPLYNEVEGASWILHLALSASIP